MSQAPISTPAGFAVKAAYEAKDRLAADPCIANAILAACAEQAALDAVEQARQTWPWVK